jgi:hypothetical protein
MRSFTTCDVYQILLGCSACMGEMRNEYKIFGKKHAEMRPLGRPRSG